MRGLVPLACLTLAASPALADQTFALVIGIDAYQSIPALSGAVNDARDIADALAGQGAETVVLTDGQASRAAILAAWADLAARTGPGDRLIVTYAGHGSNEVEATPGEETDGRDENWLLAGFAPFGPASGERIRDNEIAALIALAPQAEVILISDSCHSGTVSREIAPVLGYRYYRTDGTLADDPLPPPPPRPSGEEEMVDLALYMGAVPDDQQVPEFLIDGQPRGALSHAFADGLRGLADADSDGRITAGEMERFVRAEVREVTRGLQRPQIAAAMALDDSLLPGPPDDAPPVVGTGPDSLPTVTAGTDDLPTVPSGTDERPTVASDPADQPPMTDRPDEVPPVAEGPAPPPPLSFATAFSALPTVSLSVTAGQATAPEGPIFCPPARPPTWSLTPGRDRCAPRSGICLPISVPRRVRRPCGRRSTMPALSPR